MKFKGAIFDMDGTLVDSLIFWDMFWGRIGARYLNDASFKASEEANKTIRTMILSDAMLYIKKLYSIPTTDREIIRFAEEELEAFYRTEAKLKDGAIELLETLKKRGIPICLASATTKKYVMIALKCCGIDSYFDQVLSCVDVGHGKEHPAVYFEAASALGFDPSELCVFEDSFVALETAKAAGFQTVGVYDRYNYMQDRLQAASDFYVKDGMSFFDVIAQIE